MKGIILAGGGSERACIRKRIGARKQLLPIYDSR